MNVKMAEAVALAKIAGQAEVDQALGTAAIYGRFANKELASILNAANSRTTTQGTAAWAAVGRPPATVSSAPLEDSA